MALMQFTIQKVTVRCPQHLITLVKSHTEVNPKSWTQPLLFICKEEH